MRAEEIATRAASLVSGERERTHGDKRANFQNIARLWNAFLRIRPDVADRELSASDVATMMELLKIARRESGEFNPDDFIDGAGYAAIAGELSAPVETMR